MDARGRQRGALGARTRRALCRALALRAVVRVQKVPFPHEVNAAVLLAGAFLLARHRKASSGVRAKQQRQSGRAHRARYGKSLTGHHSCLLSSSNERKNKQKKSSFKS